MGSFARRLRVDFPISLTSSHIFFEKARAQILNGNSHRAGLLATNSIRGGTNRHVLERIKVSGDIFFAWPDEPWTLDGAAVRISIVGFDDGTEHLRLLDGEAVTQINSDLTAQTDITVAKRLPENAGLGFIGVQPTGPFQITDAEATEMLSAPMNPNGLHNSEVVSRYVNAMDLTRRSSNRWIIDFGPEMSKQDAALYGLHLAHLEQTVKPVRSTNKEKVARDMWCIHWRARPDMRAALSGATRYIITSRVSKYRVFVWMSTETLADSATAAFAREDDYFFGVLHSRAHEMWSLRMGTWLGKGNDPRYTPTTTFETYPFPWPPGQEPVDDPVVQRIAAAAKDLDDKRSAWLNPEGASEAELRKRTLTNLYNANLTWLRNLHATLDRAVWNAYGWPSDEFPAEVEEDLVLSRLLALNQGRSRSGVE